MSNVYHIIKTDGTVETGTWPEDKLDYKCIPFDEMKKMISPENPGIMIEHVNVLWQGERHHMFVDEEGLLKNLPINAKATRIYWNATAGPEKDYTDLSATPFASMSEMRREIATKSLIVGNAVLWEGEME